MRMSQTNLNNCQRSLSILFCFSAGLLHSAPFATAQTVLDATVSATGTGFVAERIVESTGDPFTGIGNMGGGEVDIREFNGPGNPDGSGPQLQIRRGILSFDLPAAPAGLVLVDAELSVKIQIGPFMGSPELGRDVGLRHSVTNNSEFRVIGDYEDATFSRVGTWFDATLNGSSGAEPFLPEDVISTDVTAQLLADYAAADGRARFRFGMEDVGTGIETIDLGGNTLNETLRLYKDGSLGADNVPTLVLTFEPGVGSPADFDSDGDVDGDDFLIWQSSFRVNDGGDTDNDGDTDGDDFLVWQSEFGSGSGAASTAVPEPTGFVLLLLGAIAVVMVRRR